MSFVTWAKKTSEGKNLYRDEDVIIKYIYKYVLYIYVYLCYIYIYIDSFFGAVVLPLEWWLHHKWIEMVVDRGSSFSPLIYCVASVTAYFHQGDVQNALKVFPEYADIQFVWISCATKKKLDLQKFLSALKW